MSRVSHIVLPVSKLKRSREWYVGNFGFELVRQQEGVVGIKDVAGLTIFLREEAGSLSGRKITITIEVENVDDKYQELQSSGVEFVSPPKIQFWGYGAEVLDPDGYMNHLWDSVTMSKAMKNERHD